MFKNNPPDFYYCSEDYHYYNELIPGFRQKDYIQLFRNNEATCVCIRKDKIPEINREKWKEIEEKGFYLEESIKS